MKNSEYCLVMTTIDDLLLANQIAEMVVSERLAACVQIDNVNSCYIFNGKLEKSDEYRLTIKSVGRNYKELELLIKKMHSYDVAEIVKLEVASGNLEYLKWLEESCK